VGLWGCPDRGARGKLLVWRAGHIRLSRNGKDVPSRSMASPRLENSPEAGGGKPSCGLAKCGARGPYGGRNEGGQRKGGNVAGVFCLKSKGRRWRKVNRAQGKNKDRPKRVSSVLSINRSWRTIATQKKKTEEKER